LGRFDLRQPALGEISDRLSPNPPLCFLLCFRSCPGTSRAQQAPSPLPTYQVSRAITWSVCVCVSVCHTYFFFWGPLLHHYLNHCCVKFHASFDLYFRPGYAVDLPLTLVPWCYCQGNPAQRPFPFPPPPCPFLFNFFLSSFFFFLSFNMVFLKSFLINQI